ncbi:YHS domain-containing protein [Saccharolobus sp. E5-1-F]|uniref:YHS domain-containing protein n=1 Tax=Saccharolobus sp. E5-1-F TaxID=2663019 RepID=UPI0015E88894
MMMSREGSLGQTKGEVKQALSNISEGLMKNYRNTVEFAARMREKGPAYKEAGEYLVAKGFWLAYRLIGALTGVSMDYLTPLDARIMSFKEFMTEWVGAQLKRLLEDYGVKLPWYWKWFELELDYWHHDFIIGLYTWRRTLNIAFRGPTPDERKWLNEKYPTWEKFFGRVWDLYIKKIIDGQIPLPLTAVHLCSVCQVPIQAPTIGKYLRIYLKEYKGKIYTFDSPACLWIFEQEPERYAGRRTYTQRVLEGMIQFTEEAYKDPKRLLDEVIWNMGQTEEGEAGLDPTDGAYALLYKEKDPDFFNRIKKYTEG